MTSKNNTIRPSWASSPQADRPSARPGQLEQALPAPEPLPGCLPTLSFMHKPKPRPEESIAYRVSCYITVLIGSLAALNEMEWPDYSVSILLFIAVGYMYSYYRRYSNNIGIKLFISVFMFWALFDFFQELAGSTNDPRIPIAKLLLLLHTGHCFDVPSRRDLHYSTAVGLVLMAFAAVLSSSLAYGLYLGLFITCALVTLNQSFVSESLEDSWPITSSSLVSANANRATTSQAQRLFFGLDRVWRSIKSYRMGRVLLLLLLFSFLIYCCIPRTESMRWRNMPMSLDLSLQFPQLGKGELINPGVDARFARGKTPRNILQDDYANFNAIVDLQNRSSLSQERVMKVRTNRYSYYRGLAFVRYDGRFWQLALEKPIEIKSPSPPLDIPTRFLRGRFDPTIQIYQVERQLPNVVFVPYQAFQLFFPSDTVYANISQNIISPFPLEEGMIYSVMGASPLRNRQVLHYVLHPEDLPPERRARYCEQHYLTGYDRYLELPPKHSARTQELAKKLIVGRDTNYLKALSICNYLRENYNYQSPPPPYDPNVDQNDEFLFRKKTGHCEQFATALAIMCRYVNIPSRYITGYSPGTYNPITGYFEVKASDAHAWVEIFQPGLGWLELDATPTSDSSTPGEYYEGEQKWLIQELWDYVKAQIPLEARNTITLFINYSREQIELNRPYLYALLLLTGLGWLLGKLYKSWRQSKAASALLNRPLSPWQRSILQVAKLISKAIPQINLNLPPELTQPALANYREMLDLLFRQGWHRKSSQTPREFAQAILRVHDWPEVLTITESFEACRYGQSQEQDTDTTEALSALKQHLKAQHQAQEKQ